MILKAYRYRIHPNKAQQQAFAAHFGCARWVYNWGLNKKQEHYNQTGKSLSKRELQDALVQLKHQEDTQWLREVNSQTLLAALGNLDTAFGNFFKKKAKFPKFKSKYSGNQSYQCPQHVTVDIEKQTINLPKIKDIKAIIHREFVGNIKTCTVRKTSTGKYFVSILVETPDTEPAPTIIDSDKTIGIDLGIKDFLITSTGDKTPAHQFLRRNTQKLKRCQRRLAKKQKNSSNRKKAKNKLARLHDKIANQRLDAIHQASAKLVYKSHDTAFAIEDLNVKGMMSNHKLAKSIADCGWGLFVSALSYKSKWAGKNVITIDRWAPSSKTCSHCGERKVTLSLSERSYVCEYCDIEIDRDINAAINIKRFALETIGQELPKSKPVDHALAGNASGILATHGMKQEAATRALA